jgi:5-methyltetrahydropteroyltriglutamate--homocysteine methyltransferase
VSVAETGRPPFRAEHIGSLLRPGELLRTRRGHEAGEVTDEELRQVEDRSIEAAIAFQEAVGLESITDGEFRRHIYFGHFAKAVHGFEEMEAELAFTDETGRPMTYVTDVVTGRLRRERGIATADYEFVRAHTRGTPKVTLPSPSGQHYFRFREGVSDVAYPELDEFFADVARVFQEELAELHTLGATYVQLDDVSFPLLCDPERRGELEARGYDVEEMFHRYVEVTNAAVAGRPAGLTVGMHLCRGNNQGKWLGEGSYEFVAEALFGGLDIDAFFLEYDTERAGGFEPLRFMAPGKHVVLGLVSSKTPELEDRDELLRRIDEAARYVSPDRLSISPQCGFASVEAGNPISPDDQRRKLELVVEVAHTAWP